MLFRLLKFPRTRNIWGGGFSDRRHILGPISHLNSTVWQDVDANKAKVTLRRVVLARHQGAVDILTGNVCVITII